MLNQSGPAALTASLLAERRTHMIDQLFSMRAPNGQTMSLYSVQPAAAPPLKRRAAAAHSRPRLTVRLTTEQRWQMRVAATILRQSCQAFVTDALDRHIAGLAREPAHGALAAMLGGAPASNG